MCGNLHLCEKGWAGKHGKRPTDCVQRWRHRHHHHDNGAGIEGAARSRPRGARAAWPGVSELRDQFRLSSAIYWNNHHHLLHTVDRVNGLILWANTASTLLAVADALCDGLDGRESFRSAADRSLWRGAVDARYRLLPAAEGDHADARHEHSGPARALGSDIKGKISPYSTSGRYCWRFASRGSRWRFTCWSR